MFWLGFGAGIVAAGVVMVCALALCCASKASDEHAERLYELENRGDNNGNDKDL